MIMIVILKVITVMEDDIDEMKQYELRANSVIEIVQPGNVIALYSPPTAFEMFYLCKVLDTGIASEKMVDESNHNIDIGTQFIMCQYFEKVKEKRSYLSYKILPQIVYVLPSQVMNPMVNLNDNLELPIDEYQWLLDSL